MKLPSIAPKSSGAVLAAALALTLIWLSGVHAAINTERKLASSEVLLSGSWSAQAGSKFLV